MTSSFRSSTQSRRPALALATGSVLLLTGLAACGDAGTDAPGDSGPPAGAPSGASVDVSSEALVGTGTFPDATGECALFDPEQVEAVVGGEPTLSSRATSCRAEGPDGSSPAVSIRMSSFRGNTIYTDVETFRIEHTSTAPGDDQTWVPVDGVGEAAYFIEEYEMSNLPTLRVAGDTHFVTIDLSGASADSLTTEELISRLAPVAATAVDRMPAA